MSLPTKTRSYHLLEVNNIVLRESDVPKLGSNEVLVKIHAVSLQYRDIVITNGTYPTGFKPGLIPCSDAAAEIISVGNAVKDWKVGDRVCANFCLDHLNGDTNEKIQATALGGAIDGVLAEYKVFPAHSLVRIPENFTYEEASTLPCAALSAYNALLGPTPLKGGDFVLVQGTGGVSIFALQFAVASGATVIATSSSDEKLEVAKKLGAKYLINYKKTPNWDEEALKITNGRGVDHIVEVGGAGTIERSMKSVRPAGWIHTIGFVSQDPSSGNIIMSSIRRACMIRGIQIGSVKQFEDMNRLISATGIKPVIDKVFSFEEYEEALKYLGSQQHVGKVVVKVAKS